MTEHERLLIETNTEVKWLKDKLADHLKKHWWFTTTVVAIAVTAILTGKFLA